MWAQKSCHEAVVGDQFTLLLRHLSTPQPIKIFSNFTPTIYMANHSNFSTLLKLLNRLKEPLSSKKCIMFMSIDFIFLPFQLRTDETKH